MLKPGVTGLLPPGAVGAVVLPKLGAGSVANPVVGAEAKSVDAAVVGVEKPPPVNVGTAEDRLGVGTPLVGRLVDTLEAPATFSCVRP